MKKYYVDNDTVLSIIKEYKNAEGQEKENIRKTILNLLSYLVKSKIKRYKNQMFYADLLQEGNIGLLKAIKDFDINRGLNFFKFACWHIQHQIRFYMCWNKRTQNVIKNDEDFINPDDYFDKLEISNIITYAVEKLPEIDRKVIIMHFGMYNNKKQTFKEIGEKLSLSKQRIEQIQKRAILKLKNDKNIKQFGGYDG